MSSVNKVILVGNLGQDPEIRIMPDGSKMASFSVATSERWKDKTGEDKSITEWHRIVVFSPKLAETLERILKKGKRVYVEGSQRTRKWIDKEGREQKITEVIVRFQGTVVVLDSKSSDLDHESSHNYNMEETESNNSALEDDAIPF
jgi:single-strand DNA-binding protein